MLIQLTDVAGLVLFGTSCATLFARTLRGDESQELQSKLRGCPGFASTTGVLAASASRLVTLLPSSVPKDGIPARVELLNATLTPLAWKRSPAACAGAAAPAALQELKVLESARVARMVLGRPLVLRESSANSERDVVGQQMGRCGLRQPHSSFGWQEGLDGRRGGQGCRGVGSSPTPSRVTSSL